VAWCEFGIFCEVSAASVMVHCRLTDYYIVSSVVQLVCKSVLMWIRRDDIFVFLRYYNVIVIANVVLQFFKLLKCSITLMQALQ